MVWYGSTGGMWYGRTQKDCMARSAGRHVVPHCEESVFPRSTMQTCVKSLFHIILYYARRTHTLKPIFSPPPRLKSQRQSPITNELSDNVLRSTCASLFATSPLRHVTFFLQQPVQLLQRIGHRYPSRF